MLARERQPRSGCRTPSARLQSKQTFLSGQGWSGRPPTEMGAKERERKVTGLVPIMVQGLEPEGGAVSQFSEKMGGGGFRS